MCKCECITKERAESIQSVQDATFVIVGAVLVGVSVVFMVFLAVRHEYVVENWNAWAAALGSRSGTRRLPSSSCTFGSGP